jgi:hypothetical protein
MRERIRLLFIANFGMFRALYMDGGIGALSRHKFPTRNSFDLSLRTTKTAFKKELQ